MDEENGKFWKKVKENPSVPVGLVGLTGVVIYGIYNFKNRKQSRSLYLIQLRVAAQGTVLGCITVGLIYTICQKHLSKLFPDSAKKNQ